MDTEQNPMYQQNALPPRVRQFLFRFIMYSLAILILGWTAQSLWFHSLPRTQLKIGSHTLHVVVADTPRSRAWGLMFRLVLNEEEGMLFVNDRPRKVCMWMKYTFIPLSVAFVREDGAIASVDDMEPMTLRRHCAPEPVNYALEVPQGWFATNAVTERSTVTGLPHQAQ